MQWEVSTTEAFSHEIHSQSRMFDQILIMPPSTCYGWKTGLVVYVRAERIPRKDIQSVKLAYSQLYSLLKVHIPLPLKHKGLKINMHTHAHTSFPPPLKLVGFLFLKFGQRGES